MARFAHLFPILLLCFLAHAQTYGQFINSTFEPGQSISVSQLKTPNGSYSLISADNTEAFVFDNAKGEPVTDDAAILSLLTEDLYGRANYAQIISDAKTLPIAAQNAKAADEDECMQYTGSDMHECTDKDSCAFGCRAVPQCETGLLYAAGSWESILDWTQHRKTFNSTLSSFADGIDSMRAGGAPIDAKLAALDQLISTAANMSGNSLFLNRTDPGCTSGERRCFEYCKKINYSLPALTSLRSSLATLKSDLSHLAEQQQRAAALGNTSRATLEYVAARPSKLTAIKFNMDAQVTNLNKSYIKASVYDAGIQAKIISLSSLSLQIAAVGDSGRVKAAIAQSKDFDAQADALSKEISALSANKAALKSDISSLDEKIRKSSATIGNATAQSYSSDLAAISAKASGNLSASNVTDLRKGVSDLNSALDKQIVDASLSGAGSAKPSTGAAGCPLTMGMIALAALASFARRK